MMSKKSESNLLTVNRNRLVPKLRFPEFLKNSEWEKKNFKNFGYFIRGLTYNSKDVSDNGLLVLRAGNIKNENLVLDNDLVFVNKECPEELYLKPGDIVICMSSGSKNLVGKNAEYVGNYPNSLTVGAFCSIFRSDNRLMKYIFQTKSYENHISLSIGEGNIKNLSNSDLELFEFWTPVALSEQQKIADCLSSIDEVITAETQKLEALKQHKKGLLQNLFPREGEKVPRLRFPEFKDSGEWEEKKLGDVYIFQQTNSFSRQHLNYKIGKVKNIHYGDIHTKFNTLFDITKENVPYINPEISLDTIKDESYCQKGDIIFADVSEDLNDVGKSIEIINLNNEKLLSGLHTILARPIDKRLVVGFGGYLFKSDWIRKQIQKESQGVKVIGISPKRLSEVKIKIPTIENEQKKIVIFLSAIDDIISAQTEKLETLKNHKKGLLQGLFPEVN